MDPCQVETSVKNDEQLLNPSVAPSYKTSHDYGALYKIQKSFLYCTAIVILYTVTSYLVLGWAMQGPSLPGHRRVFFTGNNAEVTSIKAGLFLSLSLVPLAILLRKLSNDFDLVHPFALAAQKQVKVDDLDVIMDGGLFSLFPLWRYSKWFAFVQVILMLAGASVVPVGTLMLTVDNYAPDIAGTAVVGVPTKQGGAMSLHSAMGVPHVLKSDYYGSDDLFLRLASALAVGGAIKQTAMATVTPGRLGPSPTINMTFEQGVRYHDILTFNWEHGCLPADDEINITFPHNSTTVEFVFPDGTKNSSLNSIGNQFLWSASQNWTSSHISLDGYTYIATNAPTKWTQAPIHSKIDYTRPHPKDGLQLENGQWLQRYKCQPTITWEISSCLWTGSIMDHCSSTPNNNTSNLDIEGLNAINKYMTAIAWYLYNTANPVVLHPQQPFALTASQMDKIWGFVALAIVDVVTEGFFGTMEVQTAGQSPLPVYIARMIPLAAVSIILTLTTLVVSMDLVHISAIQKLPVRKKSLLTIASSVRGVWWDSLLSEKSTLSQSSLRKQVSAKVKFGVDGNNEQNVGLALDVLDIRRQ